jgi:PKD repeat protein
VLDYNYNLRKFNTNTGAMLWERNLKKLSYQGYPLKGARIGYEGKNYVVWFELGRDILFLIMNIESDSVIGKLEYFTSSKLAHLDAGVAEFNYNMDLSSNYLFYYATYFGYGSGKYSESSGFFDFFKLNDSTWAWQSGGEMAITSYLFHPISNKVIYTCYMRWWVGPFNGHWDEGGGSYFALYDFIRNTSINLLKYIPNITPDDVSLFTLSGDGNLLYVKYKDKLCIIDIEQEIRTKEIQYSDNISQALLCNKLELLLCREGNKIQVLNSKLLEPIDTISIEINNITDLKFSPGEDTLYFYDKNELYRFRPELTRAPLQALFQTNVTEAIVGATLRFYDFSSGHPDSYHWDFGDGTTSDEVNPTHVYLNYGYFKPTLTITRGGKASQYEILLTISPALRADFQFVKDESVCPAVVRFVSTSIGKIDSLTWQFNAGCCETYSHEQEPIHYYEVSGNYEVTLQIYGMKNSSKVLKKININVPKTPFQYGDFRYEINLDSRANGYTYNAFELPDETILAKGSASNLILLDSTGKIIWEKKEIPGRLVKNPYNNALYLINGTELKEIDRNGNILRTFKEPDGAIITDIGFDSSRIYLGSGSIWVGSYYCYFTELSDSIVVTNDNQIYPSFKIVSRQLIDRGTVTLPYVQVGDREILHILSCIEVKISKSRLGNLNYFMAGAVYRVKETFTSYGSAYTHIQPVKFIKVNDYKIDDHGVDFGMYDYSWLIDYSKPPWNWYNWYQHNVTFLNDSLAAFLSLNLKSERYLNIFNLNTKQMIDVPLSSSTVRAIQKLNDTCFAAAGYFQDANGLASVIFNQKGEIISMVSHPCRYGKFEHVSITPDKQLLYSGGRYPSQGKTFPYFLKTNLSFLETLIPSSSPKLNVKKNTISLPRYSEPYVYPNPTEGKFTLEPDSLQGYGKIELYNTMGSVVKTLFVGELATRELEFDISDVSSGVYFLKISQDGTVKILKIIKINK